MTIKEMNEYIKKILACNNIDSPALTAGVLLCHVLKCEKSHIIAHNDRELSKEEEQILKKLVKRLADHEPIDYIVGERWFMGLPFTVGRGVLIPRPDTELLVEKCVDFAKKLKHVTVLDMCTGSGCVLLSICSELKKYSVDCMGVGVDRYKEALKYARFNAEKMGLQNKVHFIERDVLKSWDFLQRDIGVFTIMSINPPYIPTGDIVKLDRKVKDYEPVSALDGGTDGLMFYRAIADKAASFLERGGLLAMEIGFDQGKDVKAILNNTGKYEKIEIFKDLAGLERVVTCRLI